MTTFTTYGLSSEYLGGKHRAEGARRDRFGRFMPNDTNKALPAPLKHGQAGGRKRAQYAKRDSKGRFVRSN